MSQVRQRLRRSLVLKATLLFAVAALVPFLLASAFLFRSARTALYAEIVNGLDVRVVLMRDTLDARLAALRGNALAWAGLDVMNDLLAEDLDKRVSVVLEGLKRDYRLDGEIYALNPAGRVVAASLPMAVGRSVPAAPLAAALGGRTQADDLHVSSLDGLPVVSFTVPIRARAVENRAIGVLLLDYHVRDLARSVLEGAVPLSAITRPNGDVVAASSRWAPELEHVPAGWREYGPFVVATAATRRGYDQGGWVWTVIGAADRDVVLAPITRIERFSAAAGLGGIALLVALVAVAAARTVRPLTAVAGAADEIAGTMDLSHKVPDAGEDEVGRVARAFNRMVDEVNRHVDRLLDANIEMLEVLGSAIAKRDSDTSAHNYRVTLMALRLAEACGLPRPALQAIVKGSFLHDVGKIGISDNILLKPGKLDAAEYETMKTHVLHGTDIVSNYAWLRDAMDIVRHHHEKYDGSGYPAGLTGPAIPLHARIFAIADVFDALTSARPYKPALSLEAALVIMQGDRGRHFDPALLDLFAGMAPELYAGVCQAPPDALAPALQERMRAYFFAGAGSPTRPERPAES